MRRLVRPSAAAVWLGAIFGLLALLARSATAGAQVSFTPQAPAVINYALEKRVTYSITISNRAAAERKIELRLLSNSYPSGSALLRAEFGGRLPEPTLVGPGRLGLTTVGSLDIADRCGEVLFHHGAALEDRLVSVWVPAGATTTLVLPYSLADPPWPDSDYRLRASATVTDEPAPGQKLRLDFASPRPRITGRTGVRIRLRTSPRRLRRGSPLTVTGTTLPAFAGRC